MRRTEVASLLEDRSSDSEQGEEGSGEEGGGEGEGGGGGEGGGRRRTNHDEELIDL